MTIKKHPNYSTGYEEGYTIGYKDALAGKEKSSYIHFNFYYNEGYDDGYTLAQKEALAQKEQSNVPT